MKKILVLEDEANIRSFVVINLRRSGFEPIEAENGLRSAAASGPPAPKWASSCSPPKARRSIRSPA